MTSLHFVAVVIAHLCAATSTEFCLSRYCASNMIGNALEWTDDLLLNGMAINFCTTSESPTPVDLVGAGTWNLANNSAVLTWSYLTQFPASVGGNRGFDAYNPPTNSATVDLSGRCDLRAP